MSSHYQQVTKTLRSLALENASYALSEVETGCVTFSLGFCRETASPVKDRILQVEV